EEAVKAQENETPENSEASQQDEAETTDTAEDESKENEQNADADGQEQPEDSNDGETGEKKKGFFNKDKKEKKDKKDQKIDELTDQYRRTLAEFDNYRKRTEKEKSAMFEVGAKNIIEKLLPVIDSFERGLATVSEEQKAEPFVEGMDKIYKQLVKQLEDAGVKEIEAMDKEFDPNLHNAVMHVEDENVGENIIVEVFQKGYTYRDSVVRHSMVKVAN
ncbi:MAG: nucleotide exchange factor GrpE, partial [Lachnospiraceae bacterium]